ncbi:hypothetical protein ACUT1X_003346 [Pseudomonas aeruginosa]
MSEVKKISPVGNIYGWEESQFGEFVLSQDYDALADEAQALREEVAALKHSQQVLIGSRNAHRDERDAARKEVAALRARVVVPRELLERIRSQLDLRAELDQTYPPETQPVNDDARLFLELRALLSEQEGGKP